MVDHISGAYLDHASATPLDADVRRAMDDALVARWGNPEGLHDAARPAAEAIAASRAQVARLIGVDPDGLIFTAGGDEARNLAVKGVWSANRHRGAHIVTTTVEHDAITNSCRALQRVGGDVTFVPVDGTGRPSAEALVAAIRPDTTLVSIAHAQAEIGSVLDVGSLAAAVRDHRPDVAIHVDATATAGLLDVDATAWGCDAVSLSGGSMGGPRWVGATWVRPGTRLHPVIDGGAQEGGKRAGHHDVAGIVGFGEAARLAHEGRRERAASMASGATRLLAGLRTIDGVRPNGCERDRIPGHVHVCVEGVEGEALTLLLATAGVACAPGSACTSVGKSSAVLEAIGLTPPLSLSAVLFTLGPRTTTDEIDHALAAVRDAVARLRAMGLRA